MNQRARKFVGILILVPFIIVYMAAAVAVGDLEIKDSSWAVQAIYFLVAGLLWVLPAGLIVRWMQKP